MFRGSVKSTGYPLHSPVSPSFPLPCVTVCHQVSISFYIHCLSRWFPLSWLSVYRCLARLRSRKLWTAHETIAQNELCGSTLTVNLRSHRHSLFCS